MKLIVAVVFVFCVVVGVLGLSPQGSGILQVGADSLDGVTQAGLGYFDKRPVRKILIIGNSRTYFHQMPETVRRMAESTHSPVRLAITVEAWGGASFEDNWNNADVQRLLRQHWDLVILQPKSRANTSDDTSRSFETYGEKLIMTARSINSPVAMIVNWGYGKSLYTDAPGNMRQQYIDAIETATRTLAENAGSQLIDTSKVWEEVHAADPTLALYEDGNHPTVDGSYLSALMIYGFTYRNNFNSITYQPPGVDDRAAQLMKSMVTDHYARVAQGGSALGGVQ